MELKTRRQQRLQAQGSSAGKGLFNRQSNNQYLQSQIPKPPPTALCLLSSALPAPLNRVPLKGVQLGCLLLSAH